MAEMVRNASLAVGTSNTLVSNQLQEGQRKTFVVTNTSTDGCVITLQAGTQPASTGAGIVLYPQGSWSESIDSTFIPTNLDWWAVGTTANGTIAIHERVGTKI